jgi:sugar transferase (PEP-CTERM system associated)
MPYILKKYYPTRHIVFFLGEGILIFFAISSIYFHLESSHSESVDIALLISKAMLATVTFQFCLYLFDLYDLSFPQALADTITRILRSFGIGCIFLAGLYFTFPALMISTKVFWLGCLVIGATIGLWRFFYTVILERQLFTQPVVLLGSGMIAEKIASEIDKKKDSGYRIVARLDNESGKGGENPSSNPNTGNLSRICLDNKVEKIVVTLDNKRGKMPIEDLMACKLHGLKIVTGIEFYEGLAGKVMVEKVNPSWIIFSEGFKVGRFTCLTKRLIDIAISFTGLLLSLPISLVTALVIKLESPGPVFYLQERVGEKGRSFKVIKFRSMRADAEKDGAVWAHQNDTRVTRFGRFIRQVRIDEIPQMWNVLKGEMSFVGPRPERPIFVKQLATNLPYYSLRHNVKPGITGWAQICYPYGASEEDALRKLEYDLYYIKNLTLRMDLGIIFMTAKTILLQRGAR